MRQLPKIPLVHSASSRVTPGKSRPVKQKNLKVVAAAAEAVSVVDVSKIEPFCAS